MEDNQKNQQGDLKQQSINSSRIYRNLVERKRRILMNNLLSKLFSLVPPQYPKFSVSDAVDRAADYVRELEKKIEKLRERKELILKGNRKKFEPVVINMNSSESTLEVSITSGLEKNFFLHQVISVLVEEGAEVVNVTYHRAGDRVFHTIYSKAFSTRIGIETSSVSEKLKKLIS